MADEEKKTEKFDLYAEKRKILKAKRTLRAEILKVDTVDGGTMQRFYGEATKTRRALKIEYFGSRSKSSATDGKDTSIETFVYDILDELKIEYIKQKAILYHNVDAFLPDYNLIIQIHGCYFHGCPVCYTVPKNNIQRKNIEKDRVANSNFEKTNHKIMEIWEHEILNNPDKIKLMLKEVLDNDS